MEAADHIKNTMKPTLLREKEGKKLMPWEHGGGTLITARGRR